MLLHTVNFCGHILSKLTLGSFAINIIKEIGYIGIHLTDSTFCI